MRIAALAVVVLSFVFYLFVLIQFTREQKRSKRQPNSLTFLGAREKSNVSFPVNRDERSSVEQDSTTNPKLIPISRRPAAKAAATSQTTRNSDRLPYVEIALPITAVVTPVVAFRDEPHSKLIRRRRA